MMHGHEKSDSAIVAVKPTNKALHSAAEQSTAELFAAEPVEPRAETEGNAGQQSTCGTQGQISVSQALERIRQVAKERKKEKFTSLLHHISIDLLDEAFFELKEEAAPGVDGLTWTEYEQNLDRNIEDLHARVHRGAYRALPSRRTYIPKADGKQRPLAVAALEDKIVQRATAAVLNAIYEEDFLGFSYGFRPKRGQHNALDALVVGITSRRVNFILDADVASFFDSVSKDWLVRFVEHRIGDLRIIRLIQKWLKAGVLENGVVTVSEKGTGQGSVISPLLANVYLHYVFDLWAARWRRHEATGDMILMRYADDIVVGFEHEADARRFWDDMRKRFEEFSLSLNPDKTRMIEFGRFAAERRARRGLGKPETFNFLGFTFIVNVTAVGSSLSKEQHGAIACGQRSGGSRRNCDGACTNLSPSKGPGSSKWSEASSPTMPCRPTALHWEHSTIMWRASGCARCGGAARRTASHGNECNDWRPTGSPNRVSFTRILTSASPSCTQGRSRVREACTDLGGGRSATTVPTALRLELLTLSGPQTVIST